MWRAAAALFAAAGIITGIGLALPHQPEADEAALGALAVMCLFVAALLWLRRSRLPTALLHAGCVIGTLFVSLSMFFNGERLGGAAGNDEMFYSWIALFVA
jgi:hypothetical protein